MAIQFPPLNVGDPEPLNGDTYLYLITQSEFECRRRSLDEPAQWAEKGIINRTSFGYRGSVEITKPAPIDVFAGNIYSVIDGGVAHASFDGIAGQTIEQYTLIIYAEPEWVPVNVASGSVVTGPWVRTVDGQITPAINTDNLNMQDGDYVIEELPEL